MNNPIKNIILFFTSTLIYTRLNINPLNVKEQVHNRNKYLPKVLSNNKKDFEFKYPLDSLVSSSSSTHVYKT